MIERKPQGFAAMSERRRKQVASLGGLASQKSGKAHRWDSEEASKAAKKGHIKRKVQ
jgi:hypothetical protein